MMVIQQKKNMKELKDFLNMIYVVLEVNKMKCVCVYLKIINQMK